MRQRPKACLNPKHDKLNNGCLLSIRSNTPTWCHFCFSTPATENGTKHLNAHVCICDNICSHTHTYNTITYYIPIYIILYIHTHVHHTYSIIFNHIHIWFGTVSLILRHWWNMLFSATSPSCYLISIRWCNRNVVLRVELASGHPVHDGMQSPAPLSMSIHDMTQEIKWCLMIPLRTS